MPKRKDPRRVTVYEDDVARVDVSLDEEGDVEIGTSYREGNRWVPATPAPTVVPVQGLMAALLALDLLPVEAEVVEALPAAIVKLQSKLRAGAAGVGDGVAAHLDEVSSLMAMMRPAAQAVIEARRRGTAPRLTGQ